MPMPMHPSRMLPDPSRCAKDAQGRTRCEPVTAPMAPATAQQAGGRIETVGAPQGGRIRVAREEASRLLETAEASAEVLRNALDRGGHPAASPRDRHVARAVHQCMEDLVRAAGPFGQIVSELRQSKNESREAELTAEQAASLEIFSACAADAVSRAEGQEVADAAVGAGLPAGLLVALAFL